MRVYGFRRISKKELCLISGFALAGAGAFLHWPELLSLGGLLLALARNTDAVNPTAFLTPDEVCVRLRISRTTLWRMEKRGEAPPAVNFGGKKLYHQSDLEAWIRRSAEPKISQKV